MGLASVALPLASTAPQQFAFASRLAVKAQVRFYSTATGDAGSELDAAAGGSRDLTATLVTQVADGPPPDEYIQRSLTSDIANGTQTCVGATWYEFGLADGARSITLTATGGANPGGALSYRLIVDVEANG